MRFAVCIVLVMASATVAQHEARHQARKSSSHSQADSQANAAGNAEKIFKGRCSKCHTVPDPSIATDLAWLDQVNRTT